MEKDVLTQKFLKGLIKMYEKYAHYLNSGFSDDYWSDFGMFEAADCLSTFTHVDWDRLAQEVSTQSTGWVERCAQTLSDVEAPQAVSILLMLLSNSNKDVVEAAADSLNALASYGHHIAATEELKNKLTAAKATAGVLGRLVIESLEKRVLSK